MPGPSSPGPKVRVTGIAYRGFNLRDVKQETGIDLDEALHNDWEKDYYIAASQVEAQK